MEVASAAASKQPLVAADIKSRWLGSDMSWRVGICCHGSPDPGSLSPSSVDTSGLLTQPEAQKQRKRTHPRVSPFPDYGILCLLWPSGSGDLIRVNSTLPAVSSLWASKPHSQLFYILPLCGPLPSDNLTLGDSPNLHNKHKHLCEYSCTRDRRGTTLEFIYQGQGTPHWKSLSWTPENVLAASPTSSSSEMQ